MLNRHEGQADKPAPKPQQGAAKPAPEYAVRKAPERALSVRGKTKWLKT